MLFGSDPDPDLVEFARRLMAGAPRQTTIDAPKAVLRFDLRERLGRVTLPTLVLAGSKDRSVKPEHTQALADGIPQARLQRLPGPGTWWSWNAPTRSQGHHPVHAQLRLRHQYALW